VYFVVLLPSGLVASPETVGSWEMDELTFLFASMWISFASSKHVYIYIVIRDCM